MDLLPEAPSDHARAGGGGGEDKEPPPVEYIQGQLRSSFVLPSWADLGRCARAAHEGRREKSEAILKLRLDFECKRIPMSFKEEEHRILMSCMRRNVDSYPIGLRIVHAALHSQRNAGPLHTS